MQYTTGLILAVAGLAAAQSSTSAAAVPSSTAVSGCGNSIDLIIQNCLGTENAQLASCAANDWDCLCTQQTNVLTCYNNCPSDPNAFGAQQTQISYCNAAKAYGTSSSVSITATGTVSSSLSAALASASATHTGSSSESIASGFATATSSGAAGASSASRAASSAAASATGSSGASAVAAPAGLAAIFGLIAFL